MTQHRKDSARSVALRVLLKVDSEDAYANLELAKTLRGADLSGPDAAFCTELVGGTLRGRGFYDRIISSLANRTVDDIDDVTLNILRLAAHQLLALQTPPHAVANESVELQRRFGKQSATGFVNALARKLAMNDRARWLEYLKRDSVDPDERLEIEFAHPSWIIRALRDALGAEGHSDQLEDLLAADNAAPKVNLAVLHDRKTPPQSLPESRSDTEAALMSAQSTDALVTGSGPSPLGLVLQKGNPGSLTGAQSRTSPHVFRVQDQGSQLAALAMLSCKPFTEGELWLDLCAGPGGKTAVLADFAKLNSARLRAIEPSEPRAQLVRNAVAVVSGNVEVATADGTTADAFGADEYDRILVDAPCSGLGALRRRPEARWRKSPSDLPSLTALQFKLLNQAMGHIKRDGVVCYVTCSPHLSETRAIVDRALKAHQNFVELDVVNILEVIAREPLKLSRLHKSAQLWPHRNDTDAMFISLMQRKV